MKFEEQLHDVVCSNADKIAIVFGNERIRYGKLYENIVCRAHDLKLIFNDEPSRILIISHNSIQEIEMILACFLSGNIACPVNWRLSSTELSKVIDAGNFDLAVYDSQSRTLFFDSINKIDKQIMYREIGSFLNDSECKKIYNYKENFSEDRIALQYFTSGSTGEPKGILHTIKGLMSYTESYIKASEWTKDTVYETLANLFHLSGFSCIISILVGGTLVLFDQFRKEDFFCAMVREKCSRISMVPMIISYCIANKIFEVYDFSDVKKIVYGGSPMPASQIKYVIEKYKCNLEQAYGSTEACNISVLSDKDHIACISGKLPIEILNSAGKPIDGVKVKIKHADGSEVPFGERGEICIKSRFLFCKYSNLNRQVLAEDGFFHTGDMGYVDKDGYIYIVDRKDELIISGGENIYPREVENCISLLVDDVQEVCVLGINDEIWGQRVVAVISKKPNSELSESEVIEHCRKHIASYKKPKNVYFVTELPQNANNKIDHKKVRQLITEKIKKGD